MIPWPLVSIGVSSPYSPSHSPKIRFEILILTVRRQEHPTVGMWGQEAPFLSLSPWSWITLLSVGCLLYHLSSSNIRTFLKEIYRETAIHIYLVYLFTYIIRPNGEFEMRIRVKSWSICFSSLLPCGDTVIASRAKTIREGYVLGVQLKQSNMLARKRCFFIDQRNRQKEKVIVQPRILPTKL